MSAAADRGVRAMGAARVGGRSHRYVATSIAACVCVNTNRGVVSKDAACISVGSAPEIEGTAANAGAASTLRLAPGGAATTYELSLGRQRERCAQDRCHRQQHDSNGTELPPHWNYILLS
jgi:hypothetical protein